MVLKNGVQLYEKKIIKFMVVLSAVLFVLGGCGSKAKIQCGTLDDVVNHLKSKSLITGESTAMEAAAIGALNGVKYEDSDVELYVYDMNSKAYKGIAENNKVKVEGFEVELEPSAVNNKFVIFCDNADKKDEIIEAFNEILVK